MIYMIYGKIVQLDGVSKSIAAVSLVGALRWWPITYVTDAADATRMLDGLNTERDMIVEALTEVWQELAALDREAINQGLHQRRVRMRRARKDPSNFSKQLKRHEQQRDALLAREAKIFEDHASGLMDPYFPCGGRELVTAVKYDKLSVCEDARNELSRQTLLLQRATLFGFGRDQASDPKIDQGEGLFDDGQYDTPD